MTTLRLLLGREPAAWIAGVSATLTLAVTFGLPLSVDQTGTVLALVTAGAAALTAATVRPVAPAAFIATAKAAIALVLAFGLQLDPSQQGAMMTGVITVLTLILRQQVTPTLDAAHPDLITDDHVTWAQGLAAPAEPPLTSSTFIGVPAAQLDTPAAEPVRPSPVPRPVMSSATEMPAGALPPQPESAATPPAPAPAPAPAAAPAPAVLPTPLAAPAVPAAAVDFTAVTPVDLTAPAAVSPAPRETSLLSVP